MYCTLRTWRNKAAERGYARIAELADYLQADEMTHVRLVNRWLRELTQDDPQHLTELLEWGRDAVASIQNFYEPQRVIDKNSLRFSFVRPDEEN